MSGCGWFPLGPEQIAAWVAKHAHELPTTLAELSRYPMPFRKAIVPAVPVEARVALWREHLATFLAPEAELSDAQRELVRDASADLARIFGLPVPDGQAAVRPYEDRMRTLLTKQQAALIFGTLGPPEPPEGLPIPEDALG